ncbi:peptidylprolyl isomerase [Aliidiomarina minuta]|uniref:Peptidyl-prolyl cis-trans isomerase n=1 Tax=Aliidiomarina minuta TaxID=880057 RepID=A0A432W3X4_9GAMM|nr:FKBP-type peptidyl-prolyl cis-trans isomerase [Aliidiomarina minuta]RUO24065.1 peptidylprolyl isomerase [Aliidiomarina minuta]
MNIMFKSFAVSALALAIVGCSEPYQVQDIEQASDDDRQAYALGTSVGQYVKENLDMQEESEIMLDRDIVIAAFIDAVNDNSQMDEETTGELLTELRTRVMEVREGAARSEGEAYLAENAEREGVQVTDSGLQYEVIREGDGERPEASDFVQVHYRGTLVSGEVFDSSYDRGEPASFPLDRVISGWTEGLQLMSEGAHYRFVIPSDLAYGDREVGGGSIPPHSTLIFEVELLEILDESPEGL